MPQTARGHQPGLPRCAGFRAASCASRRAHAVLAALRPVAAVPIKARYLHAHNVDECLHKRKRLLRLPRRGRITLSMRAFAPVVAPIMASYDALRYFGTHDGAGMTQLAPENNQASYAAEPVSFTEAIKICLIKKYFVFSGRASQSEFWYFSVPAIVISNIIPAIGLVFCIPCVAAGSRRLHDTGKSGWWQMLPISFFVVGVAFATRNAFFKGVLYPSSTDALVAAVFLFASFASALALFSPKGQNQRNRFDSNAPPLQSP